ncbi:carbon-nitrogen hydrolase family protein [Carboxylicivirga sp. N1Y90]|uniref:carbon-nitrogen hydrolase family protein n=1 Tax=Carboxylicivirga fragile TaxID=3417571 RepID=UPI003D32CD38|nr:carbon-nitrogen hydrolase family protein [Marinilabiliaceae bacterium N1Y90]
MIFAAAQSNPVQGAIHDNVEEHFRLIHLAAQHSVELLIFPELSVTGYVREQGHKLALTEFDAAINILVDKAEDYNMHIVAGAPIYKNKQLHIGAYMLGPNDYLDMYTKQFLHDGEEKFYVPSQQEAPILSLNDEHFAPAICADIEHEEHPQKASQDGATIYLPSIFYTPASIEGAHGKLSGYAQRNSMDVLMSNYVGSCYGAEAGGRSAFWNNKGDLLGELNATDSGVLVIDKSESKYQVSAHYLCD